MSSHLPQGEIPIEEILVLDSLELSCITIALVIILKYFKLTCVNGAVSFVMNMSSVLFITC